MRAGETQVLREGDGGSAGVSAGTSPLPIAGTRVAPRADHASHTRPVHIGLMGYFGSGNLGNEGTLTAALAMLRRLSPNADLVCLCPFPDVALRLHAVPARAIRTLPQPGASLLRRLLRRVADPILALRSVRKLDALIVPGTGILDDFGERPLGMPLTLFLVCAAAKLRGIPVAFVSVGAGPIRSPRSRALMMRAVSWAMFRSYRDQVSKSFAASCGIDTRADAVVPDLAFSLPVPAVADIPAPRGTVGLGLMTFLGWEGHQVAGAPTLSGYTAKMTQLAIWLVDRGYRVRLLYGEDTDRPAVRAVAEAVAVARPVQAKTLVVAPDLTSLDDVMNAIAGCEVVVATRYHNVVCALHMERPVISIGYAKKNDVLLASMGLGAFCHSAADFDVAAVIAQLNGMLADAPDYVAGVQTGVRAARAKLAEQESALRPLLSVR